MIVFLNGRFLPEEKAAISIHDRGFLYGDSLFETIRLYRGHPFLWSAHVDRLMRGAETCEIGPPLSPGEMREVLRTLVLWNKLGDAVARITLSRGPGPRGYSPRGAESPTLLITLSPTPSQRDGLRVMTSCHRLFSGDPLARIKHGNKLAQVLARKEADDAGKDDALLVNEDGCLIEATGANLFWIQDEKIYTPALDAGFLPGVTRQFVIELATRTGIPVCKGSLQADQVGTVDGLFLTSSVMEIANVVRVDRFRIPTSPLVRKLKALYRRETDLLN